jgi:pantothenate kinase
MSQNNTKNNISNNNKVYLNPDKDKFYLPENLRKLTLEDLIALNRKAKAQREKHIASLPKGKTPFVMTHRQGLAYNYLTDQQHTIVGFAGAVGAGKSALGAYWLTSQALKYPNTS